MRLRSVWDVATAVTSTIPKTWVDRSEVVERVAKALESGKGRRGDDVIKTFEEISAILNGWIGELNTPWANLAKNVWDGTVDYTFYLDKSSLEEIQ